MEYAMLPSLRISTPSPVTITALKIQASFKFGT